MVIQAPERGLAGDLETDQYQVRGDHRQDRLNVSIFGIPFLIAATLCQLLLPRGHGIDPVAAIASVLLTIAASHIELRLRAGWVGCQQAAFVLMVFAFPARSAALVVAAAILISGLVKRRSARDVVRSIADCWFAIPAVVTIALASPGPAEWQHWPIYAAAFTAQIALGELIVCGQLKIYDKPLHLSDSLAAWWMDAMLTPVGLMAAVTAVTHPVAASVALAGVTGVLALLGYEHQERHAQTRLATRDPLTDLANRSLFNEAAAAAASRCARQGKHAGLVMIDLDDFKEINDTLGHHHGDEVLMAVADRLQQAVRTSDTVARLGGDEFAILLAEPVSAADLEAVAGKLRAAMAAPVMLSSELSRRVSISIGCARFDDADTLASAGIDADRWLYDDKRKHKRS